MPLANLPFHDLTGPLVRGVGEGGNGAVLSAFSAAKYAIQQNTADVNLLVIGDSTGNDTTEWVYLLGQWLATQYPTHSVSYRLWNDTSGAYDPEVVLGTGSGSNTIRLWNGSVAGAQPMYLTGSKEPAAVAAISADVVIFNHGHNSAVGLAAELQRGEFLSGMEAARLLHPSAAMVTFLQNANRDDTNMTQTVAQMAAVAALYGDVRTIDVHSLFVAAGKPSAWYADNIHPSDTGQSIAVFPPLQTLWRASAPTAQTATGALLATQTTNLLAHAKFRDASDYTGGIPTGWSAISSPTCAVDSTIKDAGATQSLKITGTTSGARLQGFVDAGGLAALKGNKATLAVRVYIPTGSASTVGRIALAYVNGASTTTTTRAITAGQGGWRWIIISGVDIPAAATSVSAIIYCDSAANTTSAAYYDRAILVAGSTPRDML